MDDNPYDPPLHPIEPVDPKRQARNRKRMVYGAVLLVGAVVLLLLFLLQILPYRPPHDWRTLLGGGEILAVRFQMLLIAGPWMAGVIAYLRMLSKPL